MTEINTLNYIGLSAIAYNDGINDNLQNGNKLSTLISSGKIKECSLTPDGKLSYTNPELAALSSMLEWTLVDAQSNADTGFSGLALMSPEGKIVFAFRGTDPGSSADYLTDYQIGTASSLDGVNQFGDAYDFVKATLELHTDASSMSSDDVSSYVQQNSVEFTGHSLGGGIAQYMTYMTEGKSTTFNGVGIGHLLYGEDLSRFYGLSKDYVNADDVIGGIGTSLGETVYIEGNLDVAEVDREMAIKALDVLFRMNLGTIPSTEGLAMLKTLTDGMNEATRSFFDYHSSQAKTEAHDMEHMIQKDEFGNVVMKDPVESSDAQILSNIVNEIADFGQGINRISSGVDTIADGVADFTTDVSNVISSNTQNIKDDINNIIDNGVADLKQKISMLGDNSDAIRDEISSGIADIANRVSTALSAAGLVMSDGFMQSMDGLLSVTEGVNLVDAVQDVVTSMLSGQSLSQAVLNEQKERLGVIKEGVDDISAGIASAISGAQQGYVNSSNIIYQEVVEHFGRVKLELTDMVSNVSDIGVILDEAISGVTDSVFNGLDDIWSGVNNELSSFSNSMYNGMQDIGRGVLQLADNDIFQMLTGFNRFMFMEMLGGIASLFESASIAQVVRADPLILDLDGDGIETISVDSGTFFDLDSNGLAEQTGWVAADDGLLTLDRNGNNSIDNGNELFGDQTLLQDGTLAASGFQALSELDSNLDGKIDASDDKFHQLKVWQDVNGDGISANSEMKTLTDLGITSISLGFTETNTPDGHGNIQARLGSYHSESGLVGDVGEYLFQRNTANSRDRTTVDMPDDIMALPNLEGAGNVTSLQRAMAADQSGELKTLVESFITEVDVSTREGLLQQILHKWTGSDAIDPAARGGNIDARNLVVLEQFFGSDFTGVNGDTPNVEAAVILNRAYSELSERMYSNLISQSHLEGLMSLVSVKSDDTSNALEGDLSSVQLAIESVLAEDVAQGTVLLGEFSRVIKSYGIEDSTNFNEFRDYFAVKSGNYAAAIDLAGAAAIVGTNVSDSLSGTIDGDAMGGGEGDDYINAGEGNNVLYGQDGNDVLQTGSGNDVLDGGAGDDKLYGSSGDDTYVFGRGYGTDTINDYGAGSDSIVFGEDKLKLIFGYEGNNLKVSMGDTTDTLTIENWAYGSDYQIESLRLSDGSEITNTQVEQLIQAMATFSNENNGMSWSQALQDKPQDVNNVLSQFWVQQSN